MDPRVVHILPDQGAKDVNLLLRPPEAPRQKRHEKALQPDIKVHLAPVPDLLVMLVLGPRTDRPLELPLDTVLKPDLSHDVLVCRRHVKGTVQREAGFDEKLAAALDLGAFHAVIVACVWEADVLELQVAAGLEGTVGVGA